MQTTLVLGIGNTLLSDEGIGVHVLAHLRDQHPDLRNVSCVDGGTLSFALAAEIQDHDQLIVIDAAQVGGKAGSVRCMEGRDMDRFLGAARRSVHEVGLLDLMDIARLTESLPGNRALIGIQPAVLDWGASPTAAVQSAIPEAAALALELLTRWQQRPCDSQRSSSAATGT
ncbi:MAG TPA: hydrogenase maturation protease [Armatimonadetes bacterium]|nr:hydrogenase maturation protease [Armatimonadota bacterium]